MFVINPDPYSVPCYRIGPFTTNDIGLNNLLPISDEIDQYLTERFGKKRYIYTFNGRESIFLALQHYHLLREDIVTILTTTGNFYISSCVTREIEKFCRWSRKIEPQTKVILVNHEFGYPFRGMKQLEETGIPIIEDCAHAFFSYDVELTTGTTGDFAIYSFPKMFPLQIGGLLVANDDGKSSFITSSLKQEEERYIKNVLSHYISRKDEIIWKRLQNYHYLAARFRGMGLRERFELTEGIFPGVFMFSTKNQDIDLPELKKYFWAHGIQCSVFYGEESFFVPVNQALNQQDLDYFVDVMKSFIKTSSK